MKKIIYLFLAVLFSLLLTESVSAKTYNGWYTVKMGNEIEFQLPPTLELQSREYTQLLKDSSPFMYAICYPPGMNRIIAQQKGLNERLPEALSHYIRVFVYVNESDIKFPSFGEPLNFAKEDLEEVDLLFAKTPFFVGIVKPACITEVDGVQCVHIVYSTQSPNYPIAINDVYFFYNGNKIYKLNTMVRSTEYELWTYGTNDVRNIANTLKLIN